MRRVSIPGKADRFDHTLPWHSHLYCLSLIPVSYTHLDLLDHFQRNVLFPILNGSCRHRKIKTAQRLAQVAALSLIHI